ncbi:hypothetical protein GOU96_18370 [Vibrio sp. R-1]|uniref:hypothetical protein n=1 Tax=Vibrio TaxID=662 RepID=UPI002D1F76E4|nr:hypothetical protein [Vibrio sp. R-1]MEB3778551.1 hypothetical protein [Vibrio sp. R-1]
MGNWQEILNLTGSILGVISFGLTVFGTWGKLKGVTKSLSNKANNWSLNNRRKRLDEIVKFQNGNYLFAYVAQKLILIVLVLFFVQVIGIKMAGKVDLTNIDHILGAIACWLIGNLSGNAFRACKNVINADKIIPKLEKEIEKLEQSALRP